MIFREKSVRLWLYAFFSQQITEKSDFTVLVFAKMDSRPPQTPRDSRIFHSSATKWHKIRLQIIAFIQSPIEHALFTVRLHHFSAIMFNTVDRFIRRPFMLKTLFLNSNNLEQFRVDNSKELVGKRDVHLLFTKFVASSRPANL